MRVAEGSELLQNAKKILGSLFAVCWLCDPAVAAGKHIACVMNVSATVGAQTRDSNIELDFYLDDAGEKLVSDDPMIEVRATTAYSDVLVRAKIKDTPLGGALGPLSLPDQTLLGYNTLGDAEISIDRLSGRAFFSVGIYPEGSHLSGSGVCNEIAPPPAKF